MSLKSIITAGYGYSIYKQTTELQHLLKKQSISKNQTVFLQRCLTHKILPKSFRRKSQVNTSSAKKKQNLANFVMLKEAKKAAWKNFHYFSQKISTVKTSLQTILSPEHKEIVFEACEKSRENNFIKTKKHLKNKFDSLCFNKLKPISSSTLQNPYTNLCPTPLTEGEIELLSKGPGFCITPKELPVLDILTITEEVALSLEEKNNQTAEELRQDVVSILKHSKAPKTNISKRAQRTLHNLQKDPKYSVYEYDKGKGLVKIPTTEAKQKEKELTNHLESLKKDPTNTLVTKTQIILRPLKNKLGESLYKKLYPSDAIPSRAYAKIKVHKEGNPARLIVSSIGTAIYELSSYLVSIIQPTLNASSFRVKRLEDFVDKAKSWQLPPNAIQASFDIEKMYPSIHIPTAINSIMAKLRTDPSLKKRTKLSLEDIEKLLKHCLDSCYFMHQDEIKKLKDEGPTGLSLLVVAAESCAQDIESEALCLSPNPPINLTRIPNGLCWNRFVDDTHSIFESKKHAMEFLELLNSLDDNIKWTIEIEDKLTISFIGVNLKRNPNGGPLELSVYRKPTWTGITIKPTSNYDKKIAIGTFKNDLYRAHIICSPQLLNQEINFIVKNWVDNGWKKSEFQEIANKYKPPVRTPDLYLQPITMSNTEPKTVSTSETTPSESQQNTEPKTVTTSETTSSESQQKPPPLAILPFLGPVSYKLKKAFKRAGSRVVFKSINRISDTLCNRNKPKLPPNSKPGIYKIECECGSIYIGQTSLSIKKRVNQHHKNAFTASNIEFSGASKHSATCTLGRVKFEEAETLAVEPHKRRREIREGFEMKIWEAEPWSNKGMNRQIGQHIKSQAWEPIVQRIREKRNKQSLANSRGTLDTLNSQTTPKTTSNSQTTVKTI